MPRDAELELMLDRVTGLGLTGPVGDAELDEIDTFFRSHAHRRKGAQNAIFAARIRRARKLGVSTETGELVEDPPRSSYRNILRTGFGLRNVRPNLVRPD
jgi:hypothetical protein